MCVLYVFDCPITCLHTYFSNCFLFSQGMQESAVHDIADEIARALGFRRGAMKNPCGIAEGTNIALKVGLFLYTLIVV